MAKTKEVQVAVQIVGVSGRPEVKTIKVKEGATLEKVLKDAGVDTKHKDLMVNGQPATLKIIVTANAQIDVVERPRGS